MLSWEGGFPLNDWDLITSGLGISVRWSWIRACWDFVLSLAGSRNGLIKKFTQPSHSDMNSNHTLTLPETKPASSPSKKSDESIVFQQKFTFRGQLSVSFREDKLKDFMTLLLPKCSIYEIFTYIYHKFEPNVGKYSIHGASGLYKYSSSPKVESDWLAEWIFTTRGCNTNLSQKISLGSCTKLHWLGGFMHHQSLRFARDENCQTTWFLDGLAVVRTETIWWSYVHNIPCWTLVRNKVEE